LGKERKEKKQSGIKQATTARTGKRKGKVLTGRFQRDAAKKSRGTYLEPKHGRGGALADREVGNLLHRGEGGENVTTSAIQGEKRKKRVKRGRSPPSKKGKKKRPLRCQK